MAKFRGSHSSSLILNSEFETKLWWFKCKNKPAMAKATGQEYKIMSFVQGQMNGFRKNYELHNIQWWELGEFDGEPQLLHNPELVTDLKTLEI